MTKIKILILCASILLFKETQAVCKINVFAQNVIRPLKCYVPEPLVLDSTRRFPYPVEPRIVEFQDGENIEIRCPGRPLKYGNVTIPQGIYKCKGTKNKKAVVRLGENDYYFENIKCQYYNYDDAVKQIQAKVSPKSCHHGNLDRVDIGYEFQTLISVCFDTPNNRSLYSTFLLTRFINNGGPTHRLFFFYDNSGIYNKLSVDKLYYWEQQKKSVAKFFPNEVPNFSSDYSWNKGHLTANRDFLFRFQRYTTFEYVNVAPQWSEFNSGNWEELENAVRRSVEGVHSFEVPVYTGVFGTITVSTHRGKKDPLVLESEDTNARIPVPKWFWKHVKSGDLEDFVFFGWNNPFSTKKEAEREFEKICGKHNKTKIEEVFGYPVGLNRVTVPKAECTASGSGLSLPRFESPSLPRIDLTHVSHNELRDSPYVPNEVHTGLLYVCNLADIRDNTVEGKEFKRIISDLM